MGRPHLTARNRPRELRRAVVLQARLRTGIRWSDTCILNVSSRGLMIHSGHTGPKGSLVEICRGEHVIVARVAWRDGSRAGLRSEERVPIEEIVLLGPCRPARLTADGKSFVERRRHARQGRGQSSLQPRWIEFVAAGIIGTSFAIGMWSMAERAFARPMAMVTGAFGNQT